MMDKSNLELKETVLSSFRSTFLALFGIFVIVFVPISYVAQSDKPNLAFLSFLFVLGLAASWLLFKFLSFARTWRIHDASLEIIDEPLLGSAKSTETPFSEFYGYSIGEPEVYPGIRNRMFIVWIDQNRSISITAPTNRKWSAAKHAFIDLLLIACVNERVAEIDITKASFWTTKIGKCISGVSLVFLIILIIFDYQADPPISSTERLRLYAVLAPVVFWIAAKSFISTRQLKRPS